VCLFPTDTFNCRLIISSPQDPRQRSTKSRGPATYLSALSIALITLISGFLGGARPAHASFFSDIFSFFIDNQNPVSAPSATSEQMPILQAPLNSGAVSGSIPTQVSDAISTTSSVQTITFPSDSTESADATTTLYTVQSGDTLLAIAVQYKTTISAIIDANNLQRTSILHLGQKIIIPVSSSQ
jgi:LysM repeat protein